MKTIALVRVETLGPLLTHWLPMTSIPDEMRRISSDKLPKALSQKQQIFPKIFTSFLKSTSNLEHFFLKKDKCPCLSISQIIDSERGGFLNV